MWIETEDGREIVDLEQIATVVINGSTQEKHRGWSVTVTTAAGVGVTLVDETDETTAQAIYTALYDHFRPVKVSTLHKREGRRTG